MGITIAGLPGAVALQETQAEVEEEHGANPVLPDTAELIWGAIAFAVLFVALAKLAFPKIRQAFEDRTAKIQGDLERAEQAKGEAESLAAGYEEKLREARDEANRIIEEARKTAESVRKDLMAKAEVEARQIVARARDEIQGERDRAFEELRRSLGDISVELAGRVVGESLSKDRHAQMVDAYIDELAGKGGSTNGSS